MGEKWQGPYLKPGTTLEDPWGHKVHYELNDTTTASTDNEKTGALPYKLSSYGPDGLPDTDDDIKLVSENSTDATANPSSK